MCQYSDNCGFCHIFGCVRLIITKYRESYKQEYPLPPQSEMRIPNILWYLRQTYGISDNELYLSDNIWKSYLIDYGWRYDRLTIPMLNGYQVKFL